MRLIDADVVTEIANEYMWSHEVDEVRFILGKCPTIEAEPVKHGRWIGVPITKGIGACPYFNGEVGNIRHQCVGSPFSCPCKRSSIWEKSTYHCSECGLEVGYSEKSKTNYCSNCGAKMDLED